MNKQETVSLILREVNDAEVIEHPAVFTMEEMHELHLEQEEKIAKNFFLRDDKKRTYWLISVKGDRMMDLKALRTQIGSRPLSFASEQDLMNKTGLMKGSVTPLGALNDASCTVKVRIDDVFRNSMIGIHPNENTATVFMNADELIRILKQHGSDAEYFSAE